MDQRADQTVLPVDQVQHLYRRDILDGVELARQVDAYRTIYNQIRPHEAIAMATPITRYLQTPEP